MCLDPNEVFLTSKWGRYYSINPLANDVQGIGAGSKGHTYQLWIWRPAMASPHFAGAYCNFWKVRFNHASNED